jgi:hypothetical protein
MPYGMGDEERLPWLYSRNPVMKSELGQRERDSESVNVVAAFVAKLGQSMFQKFDSLMRRYLNGFKMSTSAKTNVLRIAQKIEELMKEKDLPAS